MKKVTTKQEYEELVEIGMKGEYPRIITTSDGLTLGQEYHNSYDQWEPDGKIINHIRCSDDWPTYNEINRSRQYFRHKFF